MGKKKFSLLSLYSIWELPDWILTYNFSFEIDTEQRRCHWFESFASISFVDNLAVYSFH